MMNDTIPVTGQANVAAHNIQAFYESCLEKHGPNQNGMDWGDSERLIQRFHVMAGIFMPAAQAGGTALKLIDVGAGAGLFYDYLNWYHPQAMRDARVDYQGIDISPKMVGAAQQRHPDVPFEARDLIAHPLAPLACDYAVLNGVFTVKENTSYADMLAFAQNLLVSVFASCSKGVAVNFMTKHVDWEKERLFHYPLDEAMAFFKKHLSRHVVLRHDYGLWEYTAYILRDPTVIETAQDADFIENILDGKA